MSNLIIPQTAAQICQTLSESYTRLIGGYVGPVCVSQDPNSGFCIQNAAGFTALEVGNSSFSFYQNNLIFNNEQNSLTFCVHECCPVSFLSCNLQFHLTPSNTLVIGGEENNQFRGIQLYNTNPSIIINDIENEVDFTLKILNSGCCEYFSIEQNNANTFICAIDKIDIFSNNNLSLSISGNYLSINSEIDTGFNFNLSGNVGLNGDVDIFKNLKVSGNIEFLNSENEFLVQQKSIFCQDVYLECQLYVNGNIQVVGCGVYSSISSNDIFGSLLNSSEIFAEQISTCFLNVCSNSYLSGLSGYELNYYNSCWISGSGKNLIIDDLKILKSINIESAGNAVICADCLSICLTGSFSKFWLNSENSTFSGNLCVTKNITANNLLISGTGSNYIDGTVVLSQDIISTGLISSCSGFCSLGCSSLTNLCSTKSQFCCSIINCCLCVSSCLETIFEDPSCADLTVKIHSGNICSKNSPKAFGSICFFNGSVVGFTGYNICSVWSPHGKFYSLKFNNAIKAPFFTSFSLQRSDYDLSFCTGISCTQNFHCGDVSEYTTIPTSLTFSSKCRDINCFIDSCTSPWEEKINGTEYFEQPFIFVNIANLIDNSCVLTFAGCRIVNFLII